MTDQFDPILAGFDDAAPAPQADSAPAPAPENPAPTETPPADVAPKAETQMQETPPAQTGKTFSQAELDAILEKRLARERASFEKSRKTDPIVTGLERVAQKSGMTADQLLAALERQQVEALADAEGLSFEAAERLVKAEARAADADRIIAEQQTRAQRQQAEQAEFSAFVAAFPDVPADKIPPEVWESRAAGKPLAEAYRDHEFSSLKSKLSALETQLQNTKRAPISGGVGAHGTVAAESEDPFLKGFTGA